MSLEAITEIREEIMYWHGPDFEDLPSGWKRCLNRLNELEALFRQQEVGTIHKLGQNSATDTVSD